MSANEGVYKLWPPENVPVTPTGELKNGWQAGTYVYYVDTSVDPTFTLSSGTVVAVDKWTSQEGADGTKPNRPCGFLWHGSATVWNKPFEGDPKFNLTAKEPGNFPLQFDNELQLQHYGTGVATLVIASTGIFKTYVFETEDSGSNPITYTPADILYVSDNGIWTNEVFTSGPTTGWYAGYQVAAIGTDDLGDYLVLSNAW